ncbi:MAG TPA: hypothetical protein GXZ23_02485 [Clostridiales bacterium]|nr:hypothetical protein [Clostridiales bacterium]
MNYIVDIALILFYLVIVIVGIKRGLFKSLMDMFAFLASITIATIIAKLLAQPFYDAVLHDIVTNVIIEALPEDLRILSGTGADSLISYLPEQLALLITTFKFDSLLAGIVLPDVTLTISNIEQAYIAPVIIRLVESVMTIIFFFLIRIILKIVTHLVSGLIKKTVLKKVDMSLGGVFAALKGILSVGIVSIILVLISLLFKDTTFAKSIELSRICSIVTAFAQNIIS